MKKITPIIISLLLLSAGFWSGMEYAAFRDPSKLTENVDVKKGDEVAIANLMLDFGDGNIKVANNRPLAPGATVLDLLKSTAAENNWRLEALENAGLGAFVKSIDGYGEKSEDGKFWQFWVNNEYAKVGAGAFILEDRDVVMWKYGKGVFND